MKRIFYAVIFSLLWSLLYVPVTKAKPSPIEDPQLEREIRLQIGKAPDEPLTEADLASLKEVWLRISPREKPIRSLKGLEHAVNLEMLFILNNEIEDLTPIANLTKLNQISLEGNRISDLTPLRKLTAVRQLNLNDNRITDIHPLEHLLSVSNLALGRNDIADISPLAGLKELRHLSLGQNRITDISVLSELDKLSELDLSYNDIRDISVLDKLRGLNQIDVRANPLEENGYKWIKDKEMRRLEVQYGDEIGVTVNGEQLWFEEGEYPVNINGSVLVPMRALFEVLGATVEWEGGSRTVRAVTDAHRIELKLGAAQAVLDGQAFDLDQPAQLIEGVTMVPIRFVSQSLGADVAWDGRGRNVIVKSKEISKPHYRNEQIGYTAVFPKDWKGKYTVQSSNDGRHVTFIHASSGKTLLEIITVSYRELVDMRKAKRRPGNILGYKEQDVVIAADLDTSNFEEEYRLHPENKDYYILADRAEYDTEILFGE